MKASSKLKVYRFIVVFQESVSVYILKTTYTKEGEMVSQNVQQLNIDHNANSFLLCSVIVKQEPIV